MKKILLVLGVVLSAQANAMSWDGYEFANWKLKQCGLVKKFSGANWLAKQHGDGSLVDARPMPDVAVAKIMKDSMTFAYYEASSREEAEDNGWAYCMDNIERDAREYNRTHGGLK